uniref:Uncharacterized protein n=1 Tax=Rhizophagus irregularis (strain DAOM 181602 / DAOM 197198 / MUCL 43194) TaxID=747089 RepID=U9UNC3_RHIID
MTSHSKILLSFNITLALTLWLLNLRASNERTTFPLPSIIRLDPHADSSQARRDSLNL